MFKAPLFIFSLPRSGSTLLQRILACHPEIATTSEPWFLLPFVYTLRQRGVFAQYSHVSLSNAMADILDQLPNGSQDYFEGLRLFAETIYGKLNSGNATYFLDKTPRYYLIINEIGKIFPDAKFIFLFRNPLAVLSSMITSFYRGKLGDWRHKIDLYEGPSLLVKGYQALKDRSLAIQYENLLQEPEQTVGNICKYLNIPYSADLVVNFTKIFFSGSMGDSIGAKKYKNIEPETLEKWKSVLGTTLRKTYAKRYLKALGHNLIKSLGYDLEGLIKNVDELDTKNKKIFIDGVELLLCELRIFFEIPMIKKKIKDYKAFNERLYVHY